MGEYAARKSDGAQVKIGTCENMYYLRYDQRHDVESSEGSLDPADPQYIGELRFRFPDPVEDGITPGSFEASWPTSLMVPGSASPPGVEHRKVQFVAGNDTGWLVSIPCPEVGGPDGLTMHKNGYNGGTELVAQKVVDGELIPVLRCRTCGVMWRAEGKARADLAELFLDSAKGHLLEHAAAYHVEEQQAHLDGCSRDMDIARRIMAKADTE